MSSTTLAPHRRQDIQGLRAIAVSVVVLFHAGLPVPGGFAGVDVFFVISGFVITAMLVREHATSGTIALGTFYGRRFRRLTPALALVVAAVMIATLLIASPLGPQWDTAVTGIGAMLLSANFVLSRITGGYFDSLASSNPLVNTWSLSVEEQFYLIFPSLLLLGLTLSRRRPWARLAPIAGILLVCLISFGATMVYARGLVGPRTEWLIGFYGPVSRAWEFGAGAALALLVPYLRRPRFAASLILGLLGMALLVATLVCVGEQTRWPGPATLVPVAAAVLLLIAGIGESTPVTRMLSSRPFVALGDVSYSWYLWHWPFIAFSAWLWPQSGLIPKLAAALSLLVSLGAYHWVEQPIRVLRNLTLKRMVVLVITTLAIPISLALLVVGGTHMAFWNSNIRAHQAALAQHLDEQLGCNDFRRSAASEDAVCRFNATATGAPIYLVGDSNAGHFSEAALLAGQGLNRPLYISTTQGCPFVDVYMELESSVKWWHSDECRAYVEDRLAWLKRQRPGTVVISNDDSYWRQDGFAIGLEPNALSARPADRLSAFKSALTKTVKEIQMAGHEVVLVQTIPHFSWSPSQCSMSAVWEGDCRSQMPVPRAAMSTRGITAGIASREGARLIDLQELLCPSGICLTEMGGIVRYRDGGHLSVEESRSLGEVFKQAIGAASQPDGHKGLVHVQAPTTGQRPGS